MTQEKSGEQKSAPDQVPWIISRTEEGFQVFSSADPKKVYTVSGIPEAPRCTCPDYQMGLGDPNWRCPHTLAVLSQWERHHGQPEPTDPYAVEERLAIQEEGSLTEEEYVMNQQNGGPQMLIKRSVSPDRRIDSLSVEFSCAVNELPIEVIQENARNARRLQEEIVGEFLSTNRREQTPLAANGNAASQPVAARLMDVGGVDTRWGRRLFVNVEANGQTFKFFGTQKQLTDTITAIGFPDYAARVAEGATLNLPCQITTKPSDDGQYINVEKVFPIDMPTAQAQGGGYL